MTYEQMYQGLIAAGWPPERAAEAAAAVTEPCVYIGDDDDD